MQEIERVAAVLKPSETMLQWINENNQDDEVLSLIDIQTDCTVILLPTFDNEDQAEDYLNQIFDDLFIHELAAWNEDETTWPIDRTLDVFLEWFYIEFHSLVYDVAQSANVFQEFRNTVLQ